MMKFIVNLAVCSFLMTAVSLIYIRISERLRNIWSAKTRRFTWIFILAGFLLPFRPALGRPAFEIILDSQPINKMSEIDYTAPNYFHINDTKMTFFCLLFALWLAGVMVSAVVFIVRQQRFSAHVARMSVPCDSKTAVLATEIADEMGIGEVRTVILPSVQTPMMTGIHTPTVILPEADYTEKELRLIIRHELTHFKSKDLLMKFFSLFCRSMHWFNPFMSYISGKLDEVCELACDEAVISGETKEEKKIYCQSIISTVMLQTGSAPKPAVSTDFGNPRHDLQHRLSMIINSGKRKRLGIVCVAVVLMILLSSTVFGVSFYEAENSNFSWVTDTTTVIYPHPYEGTTVTYPQIYEGTTVTVITTSYNTTTTNILKETTEYRATTMPVTE